MPLFILRVVLLLLTLHLASISLAYMVYGVDYESIKICENRLHSVPIVCSAVNRGELVNGPESNDIENSYDFWYSAMVMADLGLQVTEGCRCLSKDKKANDRFYVYDQSPTGELLNNRQFQNRCLEQPNRAVFFCNAIHEAERPLKPVPGTSTDYPSSKKGRLGPSV